jgi:hypothetical protein
LLECAAVLTRDSRRELATLFKAHRSTFDSLRASRQAVDDSWRLIGQAQRIRGEMTGGAASPRPAPADATLRRDGGG